MRTNDNGEIILSVEEATRVTDFIDSQLAREWDRYTDNVITRESHVTGVRRMDPEMYDFGEQLKHFIY